MTNTTNLPPRSGRKLSEISGTLLSLARELTDFANEYTEQINFETYDSLTDMTARMLAYANLLESRDRRAFLQEEIHEAEELLAHLRKRMYRSD
ncbi:hypothetical protein SH668x_000050 [Planctomicrobium sp. SH668]|uniref:hypothetical protein n=1 Tax=Planctomicrobium sp. SH668 TaxID=3448126 RepID=UPI003F5C83AF